MKITTARAGRPLRLLIDLAAARSMPDALRPTPPWPLLASVWVYPTAARRPSPFPRDSNAAITRGSSPGAAGVQYARRPILAPTSRRSDGSTSATISARPDPGHPQHDRFDPEPPPGCADERPTRRRADQLFTSSEPVGHVGRSALFMGLARTGRARPRYDRIWSASPSRVIGRDRHQPDGHGESMAIWVRSTVPPQATSTPARLSPAGGAGSDRGAAMYRLHPRALLRGVPMTRSPDPCAHVAAPSCSRLTLIAAAAPRRSEHRRRPDGGKRQAASRPRGGVG